MHNLLIETIVRQANAGAFGDLGSVENVEVDNGGGFGSTFGGSGDSDIVSFVPIIVGILAALLVACCVYCFCFRARRQSDVPAKDQNEDTSDEEHYTSSDEEEIKKRQQATIPEAQVVVVEGKAVRTNDAKNEKQGW
jgi:hypothetical protein